MSTNLLQRSGPKSFQNNGDSCAFRHCEAALGNEMVCSLWQEGRCFRQICKFRHMEIDKKRSEIPCYWENQISGCQKANCAFHHTKGRFVDGAFFPPNKAQLIKPESCKPDVQTSLPSPAPTKLSVVPTPQLRGIKKIEASENVPSPTHPPVVINAADDDEDDDDQFSEEGEEWKNSVQHSVAPGNQHEAHSVSSRKSMTPKIGVDLYYGIKSLEEIKSEKHKDQEVAKDDSTASPDIFVSSFNQIDNSNSVVRTVQFTSKDSLFTNLSLVQRLGKRKKKQRDSPLAASGGEVLLFSKKTLSERLGKRITPPTDIPEFQPKKETTTNTGADFRIKTLEEIRQEKANSLHTQSEDKVHKLLPKHQTMIYIKSLSEIQAEKRMRQLKDGIQKCENIKYEKDSKTDNELEPRNERNTAENNTNPTETTQNQAGLNCKVQSERKFKRSIINDNISSTKPLSMSLKRSKDSLQSIEKVRVKTLEEIRQEKTLRLQQTAKSEKVESVSQLQALSNHKKILRLSKLPDKPKLNVDPCVVKNTLPIRATLKQKTQERMIVAEIKPMSPAASCSADEKAPAMLPVIESSEKPSMDRILPKRLKISSQTCTPLPSASATIQPPLKSPKTISASVGETSVPSEDDFDELMWEISDDKLEAELDLDSNKDEDALLLELSKMIDS
ncbi:zinc finger CCCH domain-containing protein 11A isoform X2 [Rhinoderma darwinii]|uniref:zinc finger CCCH domain-containing protein 11A isoform X2 n=1 Tax=Rhinoderma darwinii TaxID=43563 RepID=UPI003F674EAB